MGQPRGPRFFRVAIPFHPEGFILDAARVVQVGPYHHTVPATDPDHVNNDAQSWVLYDGPPTAYNPEGGLMLYVLDTVDALWAQLAPPPSDTD